MDIEKLRKILSKRKPFEDEDEEFLRKRKPLPFDDEDEEVEEEKENTFSDVLLAVVNDIAKVYLAKPREGLTFVVEDIEVSEEEKQKLLSAVKDYVKECADPLKHKDLILCLLEKAGVERLLRAYKERNKESVVLVTRLVKL